MSASNQHTVLADEQKLHAIRMLYRIRDVEEEIARRYPSGKMRCPTHLSIGQEGTPSALSLLINDLDLAVSTHRSHAHYLAKGGCLKAMLAEIYGKQGGCSGGKGGSMHLVDESVGFKGSTAIVGNTIPIGVGLGLAIKLRKQSRVAVVYLGDGATEEGVFYEAANFAVLQGLPVLFVCENNLYSVYSSKSVRQPQKRQLHELAAAIGLKSAKTDGNNLLSAYKHLATAVDSIRNGDGPWFVELDTYRWREHCGPHYDNDLGYRTEAEFQSWKEKDPVVAFEQYLLSEAGWEKEQLEAVRSEQMEEILAAFDYAESQPFPEADRAYANLYREDAR